VRIPHFPFESEFASNTNANLIFFRELGQIISQFVWKYKNPQIAKAILRKKNGTGKYYTTGFNNSRGCSHEAKYAGSLSVQFSSVHSISHVRLFVTP